MYAFNTKLLHIWFIVECYLPHRIWVRYVSKQAHKDVDLGLNHTWMVRTHHKNQKRIISKISKRYRKALNYER